MGNLVFQATLGGQVNLVGPNTASTYNLNVPTVNSTLATLAAQTFAGTQTISSGNLVFSGTSQFVTGDFSNATVASRLTFQSSTSNGSTGIYALPNGTSTAASWQATNAADPTNASKVLIATNGSTDVQLVSGRNGTGTYLPLTFYTNGSEQMRLDTSGNLGLGITPSAWNSGSKVIQIGTGGTAALECFSGVTASLYQNAYKNSGGSSIYVTSNYATQYYQYNGTHVWQNAPSGTAGNAITFTQAMTLDASGNLGVGVTSPTARLDVVGASGVGIYQRINNTTAGAEVGLQFADAGTLKWTMYKTSGNALGWYNHAGAATAMTLDSSGNLLVGATSQTGGAKLSVGGDSTTSRVVPNTDNVGYVGDSSHRWQAVYAVNGTIQTSDGREKNTIQDSNLGLSFIQALRPVSYKWNVGENIVTYDENSQPVVTPRAGVRTHYGFIAQEVQSAIPNGVDFGGFVQEPDDGPMSLRYHEFIGPLVKAIQELKAEFDAYKAAHP